METDCALLSVNDLVPYTRVIWILGELLVFQAIFKLATIQQTCNHSALDCIHAFYQQHLSSFLIHSDILAVDLRGYLGDPIN
jgi:hypothetical protein